MLQGFWAQANGLIQPMLSLGGLSGYEVGLSIVFAALAAFKQDNIKRMLSYSSIS